jgi:uncharacterized SAM-binding protein YcdF (DUF218 family)
VPRIGRRLTVALAGVVCAGWIASAAAVAVWSRRDEARPAAVIAVLGAAQWAGHPSPVLRARLDHAVSLWRRGLAPVLILAGGRGPRDTTSEAEVGRAYVMREGVTATAVLTETEGRTTVESMRGVVALMRSRGARDAILVSDPFHMLRLKLVAHHLGVTAFTSPTRTSPISANRVESARYLLGESLKVPYTIVMGVGE